MDEKELVFSHEKGTKHHGIEKLVMGETLSLDGVKGTITAFHENGCQVTDKDGKVYTFAYPTDKDGRKSGDLHLVK